MDYSDYSVGGNPEKRSKERGRQLVASEYPSDGNASEKNKIYI